MVTPNFFDRFEPRLGIGLMPRAAKHMLIIQGRGEPVGLTREALAKFQDPDAGRKLMEEALPNLGGFTEHVQKLTTRFDAGHLDNTQRLLLAWPGVYAGIIDAARQLPDDQRPSFEDTTALANHVLRKVQDKVAGARRRYVVELLDLVLRRRGLTLDDELKEPALELLHGTDLPTEPARLEETVVAAIDMQRETGDLKLLVDHYVEKRTDVEKERFTPEVRAAMVEFLKPLGLRLSKAKITAGAFDEYFALAYTNALRAGTGQRADPIDAVDQRGAIVDWNFDVDTFESVQEQGIVRENILAAGALDYVYTLGERLGMFKLADAVVLRWASGQIDLLPGETPAKLYRYWKLRSKRMQPEERAMLYTRVLNKGDGELLSGSVANEQFPELWGALMEKVAEYIARVEEKSTDDQASVSRQPIYQATRQLQYNLTEFMTGMAHMQVTEMYFNLQEAKEILEDPQVVDFFGNGRRRTLWTVLERGHKEWFGESPNIAALRTAAVDGNRVFQWIANFDPATVTEADFSAFRDAAESWILAQAAGGEEPALVGAQPEDDGASSGTDEDEFDREWDQ